MRTVKPSGDFLVKVVADGHEARAKVSDVAKGAGLAQVVTDAAGRVAGLSDPVDGGTVKLSRFGKSTVIFGDSITAQNHSAAAITSLNPPTPGGFFIA